VAIGGMFLLAFAMSCKKSSIGEPDLNWITPAGNQVDSTIYYVGPNGDDAQDGLTESTAFRTIGKALSKVRPGGTIRILPGTYRESLAMRNVGITAATIRIEGYNGIPVLDGAQAAPMGLYFEKATNLQIVNLMVKDFTDIGVGFSQSSQVLLQSLEIEHNGTAVQLKSWEIEGYGIHVENSEYVYIMDNTAHDNGPDPQVFPDYLMGTGINTFGNNHVSILGNECYGNTGGGILVEDSYNVLVESNDIHDNDLDASVDQWWDGGIWVDGGGLVTVRNNQFHDNLGPGIEISDEDFQNPKGYVLEGNISTNNYYGIFIWNFGTNTWPDSTIIKNINNQFTGNSIKDVWIVDWY